MLVSVLNPQNPVWIPASPVLATLILVEHYRRLYCLVQKIKSMHPLPLHWDSASSSSAITCNLCWSILANLTKDIQQTYPLPIIKHAFLRYNHNHCIDPVLCLPNFPSILKRSNTYSSKAKPMCFTSSGVLPPDFPDHNARIAISNSSSLGSSSIFPQHSLSYICQVTQLNIAYHVQHCFKMPLPACLTLLRCTDICPTHPLQALPQLAGDLCKPAAIAWCSSMLTLTTSFAALSPRPFLQTTNSWLS